MYWLLFALCAGLLLPVFVASWPPLVVAGVAVVGCALLSTWRRLRPWSVLFLCFFIGAFWTMWSAQRLLDDQLSAELDGRTVWLEGRVVGLSELNGESTQFYIEDATSRRGALPSRLRLSWQQAPPLINGERWRLAVNVRAPKGTANPYVFDYEAWLLARHVGAVGSVKRGERLSEASAWDAWREHLRARLLTVDAAGQQGTLAALVLGDASGLSAEGWRLLQATGTTHLLVVSGQHVTLLAGVLYALVALLFRYRVWPARCAWLPVACGLALFGALVYGYLAGWGIPVQRACFMLALVLWWRWRAVPLSMGLALLLAFSAVLLYDPLSSLQPGFWLSFSAVAILWGCFSHRVGKPSWVWALLASQWAMTVGLLPLLAGLGLPISVSGPVANLLAVPWVSVCIVPLALAGTLLLPFPWLAEPLLWLAGWQLDYLFRGLAWLANDWPAWQAPALSWGAWLLLLLSAALLLLPRGVPLRVPAAMLAVILLLSSPKPLPPGRAEVWVIDVGQGLSVLVRTAQHALLYDAGPAREGFNSAEKIIVPFLKGVGVQRLNRLLLSHADNDHAGGATVLRSSFPIDALVSGEPNGHADLSPPPQPCEDGQTWQWDGVTFSQWRWAKARNPNDASCLLRVEANGERLFLTGDMSLEAEAWWRQSGRDVRAEWFLAPHHGSKTSSSSAFLRAVAPHQVLISRGLHNAFSHPHPLVLARYQRMGVAIQDTAQKGAIRIRLGEWLPPEGWRGQGGFWQQN